MKTSKQIITKEAIRQGLRTWVEIDTAALKSNYEQFRGMVGKKCLLMAVAKANAYGHDLVSYAKTMEKLGVDWFGVDALTEALALRKAGIKVPVLVFGHTLAEKFPDAATHNIRLTISTLEGLKNLRHLVKSKKPYPKTHLKIDTGMHRQGFIASHIPKLLPLLKNVFPDSRMLEGVYTHFAAAKNPAFPKDTLQQFSKYEEAIGVLEGAGFRLLKHVAATSGAVLFPTTRMDMVRVGIGLYGLWPSLEVRRVFEGSLKLKPALSWKAIISEVKRLPAGSKIGYDFTETLRKDSTIAICPVGYWHGYPRVLSSIGNVLLRGKRARVLGRVSMDMLTLDVTGIQGTRVGDVATLIGSDGKERISAEELADVSSTVNYEIVTRLNPLMRRIYL